MDIPLHLDRLAPSPLYRQLYDQVRNAVLTGRLSPGTRLPASRDLAVSLGVGRVTVTTAYDRLAAEGYVESRIGGYTTVAASLPAAPGSRAEHAERTRSGERLLSRRVADLRDTSVRVMERPKTRVEFDFRFMGQAFPMVEWRRMLARHWSAFENTNLLAVPSQGDSLLRAQIAQHLRSARAADCGPEQVLVTSNVEHALNLVAHLLLDPADEILIEDPCLIGSRLAFQAHGAKAVPVPVDADGIDPEAAERLTTKRTRLLYLTPSNQFPTGVTLSLPRRMRLLDWAARRGVLIVEDDQSSEYRYGDAPLESLQGLDRSDCVIYLGTFRKVIAGFVRVSYVVVPRVLVRPAVTLHAVVDDGPPPFIQSALAEFMSSGLFERHQRRLQRIHRGRREALLSALDQHFGSSVEIGPAQSGHQVLVRWPEHPATDELVASALDAGVGLGAVRPLYLGRPPADPGVTMAYGGLDESTIARGVERLAKLLR